MSDPMGGAEAVTIGQILGWLRDGGVIALLVVVVYGALNEWWVTGKQYRRMVVERDEYRRELFQVLGLTDRATRALDRATTQVIEGGRLDDESRSSRTRAERDVRQRGLEHGRDD